MQDAANHAPVVYPRLAAHIRRQMRLDLPPLLIAQPKQIAPHLSGSRIKKSLRESATDSPDNNFIEFRPLVWRISERKRTPLRLKMP